jgi:hypothetical protein
VPGERQNAGLAGSRHLVVDGGSQDRTQRLTLESGAVVRFEAVGYFDESLDFGTDYDLWLRLRDRQLAYAHAWPRSAGTRRRSRQLICSTIGVKSW